MPGEKNLVPTATLAAYLGNAIRRLRHARGLSQRELGVLVFVSANRIAQIELATDPAPPELLARIDAALGANGDLVDLYRHVKGPSYDHYAKRFLLRQQQARLIQEYALVIPGLVQSEAYMRALFSASDELFADGSVAEKTDLRRDRQAILTGGDAPWYRLTLCESALYRNVGGDGVMRQALAALLELAERSRADVHVVPMSAVPPSALGGSLCLLTQPDGSRSAYTEGLNTGHYYEDPDEVARLTVVYDRIQAAALGPESSVALIRRVMEERYSWDSPPLA